MNKVKGYIYRGDGKLTVIEVGRGMIGMYTKAGNYYIAPSREDLISHFEKNYDYIIRDSKTREEKEKYRKNLELLIDIINNGEVVEIKKL